MPNITSEIPLSARNLDTILEIHGLPISFFEDTIVYDLGCGLSDIGAELAVRGIHAVVTGFDNNPNVFKRPDLRVGCSRKLFAPLDNLPVRDDSADIVLATYSLPLWATSVEEITGFFHEATRVVRPQGILSIFPTSTLADKVVGIDETFEAKIHSVTAEVAKIRSPKWMPLNLGTYDPNILTVRKI